RLARCPRNRVRYNVSQHDRLARGPERPGPLGREHEAVVRRALLLGDNDLKILPVGEVDAAAEAPAAVEHEAAVDAAASAALEGDGLGGQSGRVRCTDVALSGAACSLSSNSLPALSGALASMFRDVLRLDVSYMI